MLQKLEDNASSIIQNILKYLAQVAYIFFCLFVCTYAFTIICSEEKSTENKYLSPQICEMHKILLVLYWQHPFIDYLSGLLINNKDTETFPNTFYIKLTVLFLFKCSFVGQIRKSF